MNKELLLKLLEVQSVSYMCDDMQYFITEHCQAKGYSIGYDHIGNIYVTKGQDETYPCIVAHMDTVHDICKSFTIIEINNRLIGFDTQKMKPAGIGGDDKCGIFAALECLDRLPACKAVFFVDEEVGCHGSYACELEFFSDCRFILQADRRGSSDFVNNIAGPISSNEFQNDVSEILKHYGFRFSSGAMTDVMALRDDHVGISVANISAGYYNPHMPNEYIDIDDLENVVNMMEDICTNITSVYPFIHVPQKFDYKDFSERWNFEKGGFDYEFPEDGFIGPYRFEDDSSDKISLEKWLEERSIKHYSSSNSTHF